MRVERVPRDGFTILVVVIALAVITSICILMLTEAAGRLRSARDAEDELQALWLVESEVSRIQHLPHSPDEGPRRFALARPGTPDGIPVETTSRRSPDRHGPPVWHVEAMMEFSATRRITHRADVPDPNPVDR